ncbi:SMI1/KNR4 family protein [Streptomyces sp. NBC_00102]|uniref:SMI1/KNR4 family protein n=1 Tax=Streptomyces sp. NBC_00102 TaxID=2975652 RepID=UPI002252B13F|nr:SMI1/KNR4 family protein [Streptomyces sp. NBC_00102]MCX5395802.1 SMI1/KNR4 family protein [Streptomyces sp. NBC_00102]
MKRLKGSVAPPAQGGNQVDWDSAETENGHGFPSDYRLFMEVYGQGCFDDFLGVEPPVQEVYPLDEGATIRGRTADALETAEATEYHEPELLIAWGLTTESDLLCWRTDSADPEKWTVVLWRRQYDSWEHFECGMVEFLCRYAERDLPEIWTLDLAYDGCRFVHDRDLKRAILSEIDPWEREPLPGI